MFQFNITAIELVEESSKFKFDTVLYRVYFGIDETPHYCFVGADLGLFEGFGLKPEPDYGDLF